MARLGVGAQVRQRHVPEGLQGARSVHVSRLEYVPDCDCSPASKINIMNRVYCQVSVNTIVIAG